MRQRLKNEVEQMKLQDPNFRPGLVVLQMVGRLETVMIQISISA